MAKRGPERNPDSHLQLQMAAFFGKDSQKTTTRWQDWPEPYRKIVSNMMQHKLSIVRTAELKRLRKLAASVKRLADEQDPGEA